MLSKRIGVVGDRQKLLSIVVYWTPFLSSCLFLFWWNWHYSHLQSVLLEFSLQSPRIVIVYWWTDPLLSYQQLSVDICVQLWGGICIASEGNFSQLESTRHAAIVPSSPFTATLSPHSIVTDLLWGPLSSLCFGLMVVIWGLCKGIIAAICGWLAWLYLTMLIQWVLPVITVDISCGWISIICPHDLQQENVGPSTKEASPVEDYICLNITDEQNSTHQSVVVVLRRFSACHEPSKRDMEAPEVIALQIDQSLQCIDLALYKVSCCYTSWI